MSHIKLSTCHTPWEVLYMHSKSDMINNPVHSKQAEVSLPHSQFENSASLLALSLLTPPCSQLLRLSAGFFAVARWTCWTVIFIIALIHAHNANLPPAGMYPLRRCIHVRHAQSDGVSNQSALTTQHANAHTTPPPRPRPRPTRTADRRSLRD